MVLIIVESDEKINCGGNFLQGCKQKACIVSVSKFRLSQGEGMQFL